ncbi:uncharacterized protein LOC132300237 [Cornus florida]|uniref:uncharacterized protein LOC132300237 n=1 Tax=Cornus florida TaxID=4283 RepID=UPI0028A18E68|nr:uncharacterized protein LOC132300237 [Cornus florida]XP_059653229.1 uncharacterized protein LOC132300237 [Cornus florida]
MAEMACHLLEHDEENKLNNFIKHMPTAVSVRRRTPKNPLWAFGCDPTTLSPCSGGITDLVTHIPTTNQWIITEKIKYALLHYFHDTNLKFLDHVLIQFWAPITTEAGCLLVTSDQPFGLTHLDEGLLEYRKHCLKYKLNVDGEQHLGISGRVFRQKLHECIPNVRYYSSEEYPQLNLALTCNILASFAFPVFQTSSQNCVGVLEFVTNTHFRTLNTMCYSFLQLLLKHADLKSSLCRCLISRISYEGYGDTLNEICEGLKVVCRTHRLPLAQMWVPCRHDMGQGLHLQRSASYVRDDDNLLAGFLWCSMRNDFRKGQGVVGRAYLSRKSCFCRDITRLSLTEYPLRPGARHFGLTGCFAICLQSIYTGKVDFILEFFLNTENTYGEDPSFFLFSLLETMKQNFQSCKLASGEELGKELFIEFIKPRMNQVPASFHCQSTRSPYEPGVFNNGQETQPHSSHQQLIVEVDDINYGRNVVNAEGNNNHVSCSDMAGSWSDKVGVIELGIHQEPGSFPHSSNEQLIVKVDDVNNGRNVVNAEGNTTSVSIFDEADSWSDEVEIIEPGMHQELGSFPHSSNQVEVDDINNGRNVVYVEQNNIPFSCSVEARMNQEPTSQRQSTGSPPGPDNGRETMQPHSSNQQARVEVDDINYGRNVVNAEGNTTHVSRSDEAGSWFYEVGVIELGMHQEPGSFPHSSNEQLIVNVDDRNNGRNVVNAEGNNTPVSFFDEEADSWSDEVEIIESGMPQELGSFPHSSNEVEVDDINNRRNDVYVEQNNIPCSCSIEGLMNQEPTSQCQSTGSPPGHDNGRETMQTHSSNQQLRREVDDRNNGGDVVIGDQNHIPLSCSEDHMNKEPVSQCQSTRSPLETGVLHNGQETMQPHLEEVDAFTDKDIGKFFGKKLEDVPQKFDVSKSTFKRPSRKNGISRGPPVKRNKVSGSSPSSRRDPPCSKFVASAAHITPLVTTPSEVRDIIIKATYGKDFIKFLLPFSSTLVELKESVSKRLKLNVESFKIKYTDDEGDQVLIACEKDLQDCTSAFNSLGMDTIEMFVEPITTILPST